MNSFDFKCLFVFEISVDSYENLANGLKSLSQMLSNMSEIHTQKKGKEERANEVRESYGHKSVSLLCSCIFALVFKSCVTIFRSHNELKNRDAVITAAIIFHLLKTELQKEPKSYKTVNDPPF